MLDPSALAPRGLAVALLLALGACSSDDSGPSDQVLVGTWGSERAEFVAIQAGAEVRTGCGASCMAPAPVARPACAPFESRCTGTQ